MSQQPWSLPDLGPTGSEQGRVGTMMSSLNGGGLIAESSPDKIIITPRDDVADFLINNGSYFAITVDADGVTELLDDADGGIITTFPTPAYTATTIVESIGQAKEASSRPISAGHWRWMATTAAEGDYYRGSA